MKNKQGFKEGRNWWVIRDGNRRKKVRIIERKKWRKE